MFPYSHRLIGATLLVSGCCIGAGMLGLPLVTLRAGFLPTIGMFIVVWLFMVSTGLLLLEVNLRYQGGAHLMTLAEKTLGKTARWIVGALFAFLFYCLMVAYLTGGGAIIGEYAQQFFSLKIAPFWGSIALVGFFGAVIFLGTSSADQVNRILMVALSLAYGGLILLGFPHVEWNNLKTAGWPYVFSALPAMIISFGYHNLIPSLTRYLNGNVKELRLAIILGSLIPLLIYLIWEILILGILPLSEELMQGIDTGAMVTMLLPERLKNHYVVDLMQAFAFFALVTSFLAIALSFVDFLADGLKIEKTAQGNFVLISLVLLPPLLFAFFNPALFLTALNYAGAFGAVLLFGIIPVLMAWKGRYLDPEKGLCLVAGGKGVLLLIGAFALFVFLMQLKIELGV